MAPLSENQRAFVLTLAARVVPWSASLPPDRREAMLDLINHTLGMRPPAMQRQFGRFLGVLRWAPVLRYLRPLDALDADRQDGVLRSFQDCPLTLIRSGFWGLRTLIFLGCYGQPAVGASIGYHPSTDGNAVLHARTRG